jgi:hypothetical protein
MALKNRLLIALVLVFVGASSAGAGIYNNSGTSTEDSICFVGVNITADGRRCLAIAATDSIYVIVYYPGGKEAFRDSVLGNDAKITLSGFEDQATVGAFTYKAVVANVDGGGVNGSYKVAYFVRDIDSANVSWGLTEAQVYGTANISVVWDSTTQIPTGEITTGSFTAGAVDAAALASSAASEIGDTVRDVVGDTLDAVAGNVAINWGDVSNPTTTVGLSNTSVGVATLVTQLDLNAIQIGSFTNNSITDLAISGSAITAAKIAPDAIGSSELASTAASEIGDTVRDIVGDTFNVVGGFVYADIKAVGSDAIVDNADGRLEVNLEEIVDVAVSATTAQLGVNVVTLTDGAIVAADIATDAADKIGFYTNNMGDDSGAWISGADTSVMAHLRYLDAATSSRSAFAAATDSVHVDGTTLGGLIGAITATTIAAGAITSSEAANLDAAVSSRSTFVASTDSVHADGTTLGGLIGAITATTIAPDAIASSELASTAVDEIWTEDTTGYNSRATMGGIVSEVDDSLDSQGWAATGAGAASVSSFDYHVVEFRGVVTRGYVSAFVAAALTQANDYWNDNQVLFVTGAAAGQVAGIVDFVAATDSVDIRPDLSIAPAVGDSFYIVGLLAPALPTDVTAGTGDQNDSILVLDTSGADAPVPLAKVSLYLDGYSGNALIDNASSAGWAEFSLGRSTAYDAVTTLPGFVFPNYDMTTGSGATFKDTIMGYNIDFGTGTTAGYKVVHGREYIGGDSLSGSVTGVVVTATLVTRRSTVHGDITFADTLNDNSLGNRVVAIDTSNSTGFWQIAVPMNTIITMGNAAASDSTFWQFEGRKGTTRRFIKWVYLTTAASARLIDLTGQN